jgi:hypothetical protein
MPKFKIALAARFNASANLVRLLAGLFLLLLLGGVNFSIAQALPAPDTTAISGNKPFAGFNAARRMNSTRVYHTSTVLPDGQVLIAGGWNVNYQVLRSFEIYNPASNIWTQPEVLMNKPRRFHSAALLPDGRVLVAGSLEEAMAGQPQTAETYNGSSWVLTGAFQEMNTIPRLLTLADKRVLAYSPSLIELFNHSNNTWQVIGRTPRNCTTATALQDGRVMFTCDAGIVGFLVDTSFIFNPNTGVWTSGGTGEIPRTPDPKTILLKDGRVLYVPDGQNYNGIVRIYNPATLTWLEISGSYSYASVTLGMLPDGKVIISGHETSPDTEIFDPTTNQLSRGAHFNQPMHRATSSLLTNGRLLYCGGYSNYWINSYCELYIAEKVSATAIGVRATWNYSYVGQPITLTAVVTSTGGAAPGEVTFKRNGTYLGRANLLNGVATLPVSGSPLGQNTFTAEYAGSQFFTASVSQAYLHTVKQPNVTVTLDMSEAATVWAGFTTIKVNVTSPDFTPEQFHGRGTITIQSGSQFYPLQQSSTYLNERNGYIVLPAGTHQLIAHYSGYVSDWFFEPYNIPPGSSAPLNFVLQKRTLATDVIVQSYDAYGARLEYNYGREAYATHYFPLLNYQLFGTLILREGNKELARQNLTPDEYISPRAFPLDLDAGTHEMRVEYTGDINHFPALSNIVTAVVRPLPSYTTLTVPRSTFTYGEYLSLATGITATYRTPGGNANIKAGSNLLASVPLQQGRAEFSTKNLEPGTHQLTVEYPGSTNYLGSTSQSVQVTVNKAATHVFVQAQVNPVLAGQAVTLTGYAKIRQFGNAPLSGTISFFRNGSLLGSANVDNTGFATLSNVTPLAGSQQITATYIGNNLYENSTANGFTLQSVDDLCSGLIVNSNADATTCGSLLYALKMAEQKPAGSPTVQISFAPGTVFTLTQPLSLVHNPNGVTLEIDGGCTTLGGRGEPQTRLVSDPNTPITTGLTVGNNVVVRGLALSGFSEAGLVVTGSNSLLTCNVIGVPDGGAANGEGIIIEGNANRLGLPDQPATGNLIAGNSGTGLRVRRGSFGTTLHYTWLGLNKTGTGILPNGKTLTVEPAANIKMGMGNRLVAALV